MKEQFPSNGPQPSATEGGKFGLGVIRLDPGQFKGDPRRVIGHPSNPTTEMVGAYSNSLEAQQAPSPDTITEKLEVTLEETQAEPKTVAEVQSEYPGGVLVERSSGEIMVMQVLEDRVQVGVDARTHEDIQRPVAEGWVLVRDLKGDTRTVKIDGLAQEQQRLESVLAARRKLEGAMSDNIPGAPESDTPLTTLQRREQLISGLSDSDKQSLSYFTDAMEAVRDAQNDGDGNGSRRWQTIAGGHYNDMSKAAKDIRSEYASLSRAIEQGR